MQDDDMHEMITDQLYLLSTVYREMNVAIFYYVDCWKKAK